MASSAEDSNRGLGPSQSQNALPARPTVVGTNTPPIDTRELKVLHQNFILSRIAELCNRTKDWPKLKIKLIQNGLLHEHAMAELDAFTRNDYRFYAMYTMVMKMKDFWGKLKDSLRNSGNDKAVEILDEFAT